MPARETSSSTRPRRQRKRRRTDPDAISSPSSSSSSSEDEKTTSTSIPLTKASVNVNPAQTMMSNDEIKSSPVANDRTKGKRVKRHNATSEAENIKTSALQTSPPLKVLTPPILSSSVESRSESESESESESDGDVSSSSPASSDSTPLEPLTQVSTTIRRTKPEIDAQFEAWYLRAVTSQYGNDLDRLRTEAADFKSRPRGAMAVLGVALRQGVSVFGEEDRKLLVDDRDGKVGVSGLGV